MTGLRFYLAVSRQFAMKYTFQAVGLQTRLRPFVAFVLDLLIARAFVIAEMPSIQFLLV